MNRLHQATAFAVLTAFLLTTTPAAAELCVLDHQPAATLLLPYFEVDLDDGAGVTTIFSVVNTSPESVYARVVLWTDAAYPTLGFDLYLTGFDVQSVNLRDVFAGRLPTTGPGSSPVGPYSGPDVLSPTCGRAAPEIDFSDFIQHAHTGEASPFTEGLCAGLDHGDNVARGYVTIDVVEGCTLLVPSDEGYFGQGGVALYDNVLMGEFLYLEPGADNARGENLVAIEADPDFGNANDTGYTFYGRYLVPADGRDGREPLPSVWLNRYVQGGGLGIESTQIVWRSTPGAPELFDCPSEPSWYPMESGEVLSFDEQENAVFWSTDVVYVQPPFPPFPAATQRVPGRRAWSFGWEVVDLNPSPEERSQSYVMETMSARGRYSVLRSAMARGSGCSVGGCPFGPTPVGQVCISAPGDGSLDPGDDLAVEVIPAGCFSSSCTIVYRSLCELHRADERTFELDAAFCLRQHGEVCTADCGGGGSARCAYAGGLDAGDYTLRAGGRRSGGRRSGGRRSGGLEMAFSVPVEIPPGGLCAGDPFD